MKVKVEEVRVLPGFRLWLRFTDGAAGEVDLACLASRLGLFSALSDPVFFARASIDPDSRTVAWPNGLDLDPYVLHSEATGNPLPGQAGFRAAS